MATVHIITEEEMRALMVDLKRAFEQRVAANVSKGITNNCALDDAHRMYHMTIHRWADRVKIKLPYDF